VRLFGPNIKYALLKNLKQINILHDRKINPQVKGIQVPGKNKDIKNVREKPIKKIKKGIHFIQQPVLR